VGERLYQELRLSLAYPLKLSLTYTWKENFSRRYSIKSCCEVSDLAMVINIFTNQQFLTALKIASVKKGSTFV
jgi:hypothetical protein